MRRVELPRFFARIGRKIADQIFIDEAENIIILSAIHGNVFYQINQIADGFGARAGSFSQFGQTGFQRFENTLKYFFMMRIDVPVKSGNGIRYVRSGKIHTLGYPCGKKAVIRYEVANILSNHLHGFSIILIQLNKILIRPIVFFQKLHFFIRKEFIKYKTKNIVLIFISLNFGTHLIR